MRRTDNGTRESMSYQGPDRRRHRVYVTKNTEYHFRDGFCVAVRDRRTGEFLPGHLALRKRIRGAIRFHTNGAVVPNAGEPRPGEAMYFETHERELVTSLLERVDRPEKDIVTSYPSLASGRPTHPDLLRIAG